MQIGTAVWLELHDCFGVITDFMWDDNDDKVWVVVATEKGSHIVDPEYIEIVAE